MQKKENSPQTPAAVVAKCKSKLAKFGMLNKEDQQILINILQTFVGESDDFMPQIVVGFKRMPDKTGVPAWRTIAPISKSETALTMARLLSDCAIGIASQANIKNQNQSTIIKPHPNLAVNDNKLRRL